jgi:hypothetical protein
VGFHTCPLSFLPTTASAQVVLMRAREEKLLLQYALKLVRPISSFVRRARSSQLVTHSPCLPIRTRTQKAGKRPATLCVLCGRSPRLRVLRFSSRPSRPFFAPFAAKSCPLRPLRLFSGPLRFKIFFRTRAGADNLSRRAPCPVCPKTHLFPSPAQWPVRGMPNMPKLLAGMDLAVDNHPVSSHTPW